ncbi:MAG: hypothetical protein EA001_00170 [Oscillatoriales cyanobacterium]|nr:MAG: hypothetical protein EA001_00170 [Oscillatoriales cyanobacterium]
MKIQQFGSLMAMAAAIAVLTPHPAHADTIALNANLSAPITRSGVSGGSNGSDCGFVPSSPNHRLSIAQDFGSLQVQVQGGDGLTLKVSGPNGAFCIPVANGVAQMPGYWPAGTYDIFVGDRANTQRNYQLVISTN